MQVEKIVEKYVEKDFDADAAGYTAFGEAIREWFIEHQKTVTDIDMALRCCTLIDLTGAATKHYKQLLSQMDDFGKMWQHRLQTWDKDPVILQKIMGQQCGHCRDSWQQKYGRNIPQDTDVSGLIACCVPDP